MSTRRSTKSKPRNSDVQTSLRALAVKLEKVMRSMGIDVRDANEVSSFIDGCKLNFKIARIIVEDLDNE